MDKAAKIDRVKELLDAFCDKEYKHKTGSKFTANDMILYAVDCGGYDITSDVMLKIKTEGIFLCIATKYSGYSVSEYEEFELELKDE